MNRSTMVLPAVLSAVLALGGCKAKSSYNASDTSAGALPGGTTTPASPAGSTAAAPNTTATASPTLTDANIAYILDQANAADSARGALAATKGTSADVRNFGRLMLGEHHALRQAGQNLVKKLNVTPAAPAGDRSAADASQEMDSLRAMPKGPAWDRAYIGYEVTYHRAVIQTATKALDAAQNPQLKALIRQAAPVLQHHLQRAEQIQKKLGG